MFPALLSRAALVALPASAPPLSAVLLPLAAYLIARTEDAIVRR